jgi:hypothetical protein
MRWRGSTASPTEIPNPLPTPPRPVPSSSLALLCRVRGWIQRNGWTPLQLLRNDRRLPVLNELRQLVECGQDHRVFHRHNHLHTGMVHNCCPALVNGQFRLAERPIKQNSRCRNVALLPFFHQCTYNLLHLLRRSSSCDCASQSVRVAIEPITARPTLPPLHELPRLPVPSISDSTVSVRGIARNGHGGAGRGRSSLGTDPSDYIAFQDFLTISHIA